MKPVNEKRQDEQYVSYQPSALTIVSRVGLLLLVLLLTRTSYAQHPGANIDESGIQVTYYVKTNGDDSKDGKSLANAFKTVKKALETAKYNSLNEGKKTKISIQSGTYTTTLGFTEWSSTARSTPLIIEGRAAGQVTIQGEGEKEVFSVRQKDYLVIRNINFTNGNANGSFFGGQYYPFATVREKQWLFENCEFNDSNTNGARIQGIDYVTIRNCKFNSNDQAGLSYIGRYGKFINVTMNDNGFSGVGYSGFDFAGTYCEFDKITISNNKSFGFRMDHVAEHVTITNSKFNNNGKSGMIFETCIGPVSIIGCEIAGNQDKGITLITAHDITIDRCKLLNNKGTQLAINPQDRSSFIEPDGYTAGNLEKSEWRGTKPIKWVENTTLRNSSLCVTNTDASSYLIKRDDQTNSENYERWFKEEFVGSNNTYYHANRAEPLDISGDYFNRTYTNLAGWKTNTGTDGNSVWNSSCSPAALSFSGYYKITSQHSGKALDVNQRSTANEANVVQYNYSGGNNQQWKLESVGDGYFKILARHSSKALDVASVSQANGGNVFQYEYLGGDNQKWKVESVGNSYYKIIAKHSGKALEVANRSKSDGGNVQQWDYLGEDNQKWKIDFVSASSRLATEQPDEAQAKAILAPNPATTQTTFHYQAQQAGKIQVVITDVLGRAVASKEYLVQAGENAIQIDLTGTSSGAYAVQVIGNRNLAASLKLVITQ